MANSQRDAQRFIARLSETLGTSLTLQNGVCALYDSQNRQAAVIEVPKLSDNVVIHCSLGQVRKSQENMQRLLNINFDVASLRGCWLALDQQELRLCTQRELSRLDEVQFCDLVNGFITQVQQTRTTVQPLLN
ncbi:type III secretion system chaperone [Pseudomonas cichorii]|uniref:type III secretion system chaperone n=1 Tax=Pseudomonas cichorii TaxID=36746 RepID=UPI001C8A33C1|nr:type III secretion system chaperone [Pseudomonas cichorii]MBX8485621.1 type III secretion system chaperone [Pseudomonas cichorii]MBX8496249.1 type III secretion system chaperone [Pseudomonas cichorii]MBX8516384.1 type III secretion system chaperone [Pseudomonas cichorii]MBX8528929.1 type III secretion system chaperone [Pseudomonas cichorii]